MVAVGYADGVHRARSNRGHVLVRGHRTPVIGIVSMDDVKGLGADQTVDHSKPIEGEYDFVLCFSSSDLYWTAFPRLLKPQGKVGMIVRAARRQMVQF